MGLNSINLFFAKIGCFFMGHVFVRKISNPKQMVCVLCKTTCSIDDQPNPQKDESENDE